MQLWPDTVLPDVSSRRTLHKAAKEDQNKQRSKQANTDIPDLEDSQLTKIKRIHSWEGFLSTAYPSLHWQQLQGHSEGGGGSGQQGGNAKDTGK
jgi:hypothetical protein